jgi:hypothetical protein
MNSEDFFPLLYTMLLILGAFLSMIPAYIAFKRDKKFWVWWIGTASVFEILLLVTIRAQAISKVIYLLGILPVALILAILPKPEVSKLPLPFSVVFKAGSNLIRNKEARLFFIITAVMGTIGAFLFYYVFLYRLGYLSLIHVDYAVLVVPVVGILIACLGFSYFMLVISVRTKKEIFVGILLVSLLALLLSETSNAYLSEKTFRFFVSFGISAGCISILIRWNDNRYPFLPALSILSGFLLYILSFISHQIPVIHLTKSRFVSSYLLIAVLLLRSLLPRLLGNMNDMLGFLLLFPLMVIASIIGIVGTVLSTIVIVNSIKQFKVLAGSAVFIIGVFAASKDSSLEWAGFNVFRLLIFYGVASGFAALIFWVVSDYLARNSDQSQMGTD